MLLTGHEKSRISLKNMILRKLSIISWKVVIIYSTKIWRSHENWRKNKIHTSSSSPNTSCVKKIEFCRRAKNLFSFEISRPKVLLIFLEISLSSIESSSDYFQSGVIEDKAKFCLWRHIISFFEGQMGIVKFLIFFWLQIKDVEWIFVHNYDEGTYIFWNFFLYDLNYQELACGGVCFHFPHDSSNYAQVSTWTMVPAGS